MEGGSGFLPRLPKRWVGGGGGGEGVVGRATPCTLSPALPGKRVEDPYIHWPNPEPWHLPNDFLVPGPACPIPNSCRRPSRCDRQGPINKSPSESDTVANLTLLLVFSVLVDFLCERKL